jgi:hypothetical protein
VEASFTDLPNNMDMIIGKLSKGDILKQEAVIDGSTITMVWSKFKFRSASVGH